MTELKRVGVLTSGGDAPGMNAAIRAAVRACIYYGIVPVVIQEGYKGLIENRMEVADARTVANIINQGGTFLKSAPLSGVPHQRRPCKGLRKCPGC